MDELDQYAISKILGSKLKPIGPVGFGNFHLRQAADEIQHALKSDSPAPEIFTFGYADDAKVVDAFERVRRGAAPDELLWNKDLARLFARRCHDLGLDAPQAVLIRRLFNVRKNHSRYKQHGIVIGPTTKKSRPATVAPEYAHVIEFALVKLRYRYGASIDDILMDPELGDRLEAMVAEVVPTLPTADV